MRVTFDPFDLDECERAMGCMDPNMLALLTQPKPTATTGGAATLPQPTTPPAGLPTGAPAPAPVAAPAPVTPPAPPVGPPGGDDPLPNPANLRAPSEVVVDGGTITLESFRARFSAVAQRVTMAVVKGFLVQKGYANLSSIPADQYVGLVTEMEAL